LGRKEVMAYFEALPRDFGAIIEKYVTPKPLYAVEIGF
jgi:hypothetical protein